MKVYIVDVRWDNRDIYDGKSHGQFNLGAFQTRSGAIEAIDNFNNNPLVKRFAPYNAPYNNDVVEETKDLSFLNDDYSNDEDDIWFDNTVTERFRDPCYKTLYFGNPPECFPNNCYIVRFFIDEMEVQE